MAKNQAKLGLLAKMTAFVRNKHTSVANVCRTCTLRFFTWQLTYPVLIFATIGTCCFILSGIAFCLHTPSMDVNPDQAIQTWKTKISGIFKTWEMIQKQLTFSPKENDHDNDEIVVAGSHLLEFFQIRKPRSLRLITLPQQLNVDRLISFTKCLERHDNNLLNAVRLFSSDTSTEVAGSILVAVYEAQSYSQFFSVKSMEELCILSDSVHAATRSENQSPPQSPAPAPSAVHLSFYDIIQCLSIPHKTCQNIDSKVLRLIGKLYKNKHQCIEYICNSSWVSDACNSNLCGDTFCSALNLTSTLEEELVKSQFIDARRKLCQAENAFLSFEAWKSLGPIYSAMYIYIPVHAQATLLKVYDQIQKLQHNMTALKLKGLSPNYKTVAEVFGQIIQRDLLHLVTFTCVVLIFILWIWSQSLFFTIVSVLTLVFAFGITYFVYTYIFQFDFFFTNYMAGIILLGIGADDCFILKHSLNLPHKKAESQTERDVTSGTERIKSLQHATTTMFVTSVTSAAAFFCNLMTDIVSMKSFAVFSASLVLICYALAVLWLPVCICVEEKYISNPCNKIQIDLSKKAKTAICSIFETLLPSAVCKFKYFFVGFLTFCLFFSSALVFVYPKLKSDSERPQLFHDVHPIQWFWNNYDTLFKSKHGQIDEILHVVWGAEPEDASSPIQRGNIAQPTFYSDFKITELFLRKQMQLCEIIKKLRNYKISYCFAQEFFALTSLDNQWKICTNVSESKINCKLKYVNKKLNSYKNPFRFGQENIREEKFLQNGPMFSKSNPSNIQVYVQTFKRTFPSSNLDCRTLSEYYQEVETELSSAMLSAGLNQSASETGWAVPSSKAAVRYLFMCDLQKQLTTNTLPSVLISLAVAIVVVAMVTRNLKLGLISVFVICTVILCAVAFLAAASWKLNIIESIIIFICVGMSFDFTLHYALGYKATHKHCIDVSEQVKSMFREAAIPVFLSASSTFGAGVVFVFAEAYPFYQIGVFMVVITIISWIGSTFVFTSLVAVTDTVINSIYQSHEHSNSSDTTVS